MSNPILTDNSETIKYPEICKRFSIHPHVWLRDPDTRQIWRFIWITSDVLETLLRAGWERVATP